MPASGGRLDGIRLGTYRNPLFWRWGATVAATVLSTYLLDLVAAGAGALLVMSGLHRGLDGRTLVLLLAASYVAWGAGLRVSLASNWTLLEATGASTSVFSKLAHGLAARRSLTRGARRLAASAGYVGTELAKETPYYLGVAGAALLTEVSAGDALAFLAGATSAPPPTSSPSAAPSARS